MYTCTCATSTRYSTWAPPDTHLRPVSMFFEPSIGTNAALAQLTRLTKYLKGRWQCFVLSGHALCLVCLMSCVVSTCDFPPNSSVHSAKSTWNKWLIFAYVVVLFPCFSKVHVLPTLLGVKTKCSHLRATIFRGSICSESEDVAFLPPNCACS